MIHLGHRVPDRVLDPRRVGLVRRQPPLDRSRNQITAIKLACSPACWPPIPSATMKRFDDSIVSARHLGVAFGAAVMPDGPPAGYVEIVFVVLAVVSPHRDDADFELELARQERERRKRGEFIRRRIFGSVLRNAKESLDPAHQ